MGWFTRRHKNSKLVYYIKGFLRELVPGIFLRHKLKIKLQIPSEYNQEYIANRVNYYNKLDQPESLPKSVKPLSDFKLPRNLKVYYFDNYEFTRYFNPRFRVNFLFGDVTYIPEVPSIVKSRPIHRNNENSILLKLNKVRHFMYVDDKLDFSVKKNLLVGRSVVRREHRIRFFKMYFNHPMCDLGQINSGTNHDEWIKNRLTIDDHLEYKFILCLEGNDVASNLKWVMSSNSLAVMPTPKFETWFMEGTLIPNYHYVQIKEDYSDLEERLMHYINHPLEAISIISNANAYVNQFRNNKQEDLISLLVLNKYFEKTGQTW